ncbi:hypothetical protein MFU01_39850 [Myxococcus fulvus]|uniref:Phospholipase C/D domain-containing protein n=2 Tax=Myxococcus fulvus TaxID=33 RepID=A0A511T6J2_MYXFU|nr:hypothetical protein [Myxococcus fulvus]GEN08948.1 hypothetical protein MFU01_39850 [Myxococcus fulvus]
MAPRLAVLSVLLAPMGAGAFWVKDHEALTRVAIERATQMSPGLEKHRDAVLHGATAEDLNLHVKWTGWHHYFRPEGRVDSGPRDGSAARVRKLWAEALDAARGGDLARAWDRAGHLAHHIQDVASPPHVVPVSHGLADGFEGWGLRDVLERLPPREVAPMSGPDAQLALARETLEVVRTQSLRAEDGTLLAWRTFWVEPDAALPGAFGVYGDSGNAFGQVKGVSPEAFDVFMADRAAAAIAYTQSFLTWAAQRFQEVAEPGAVWVSTGDYSPAPELSFQLLGGMTRDARGGAPVAGLRAGLPLPYASRLSFEWMRGVGLGRRPLATGGFGLSLSSPPLWAWRPTYAVGVDVRASLGAGVFSWEGGARFGVPVGLRAQAALGALFIASAEARYQGLRPFTDDWTHGFVWTLGFGAALGDR